MKAMSKTMSRALSATRYFWKGMSKAVDAFLEASKPGGPMAYYK